HLHTLSYTTLFRSADHPEPRDRPLRQYENAEQQRDETIESVPAPVRQGNHERSDQLEQAGHQEERPHQQGQNLRGDHRPPQDQHTDYPEQDCAQPMLEQAGPFADHDRLDDLNASGNHQQPPENQHGDTRGRYGAHDGENPEQRQADAESQKPAPVMDDLCRNSHIQSLNLTHGVSSPLAKKGRYLSLNSSSRYILFGSALEHKLVRDRHIFLRFRRGPSARRATAQAN